MVPAVRSSYEERSSSSSEEEKKDDAVGVVDPIKTYSPTAEEAIKYIFSLASQYPDKQCHVLVCGSLYLAGDILACLTPHLNHIE
jgi:folylpolyglutamate synthase/dihydropteroate synthase